jgi:hypothetical protein
LVGSSETSVLTRATRRNNPENTILHSHRRENLKSYIVEVNLLEGSRVMERNEILNSNLDSYLIMEMKMEAREQKQ